jgi:hypothetical protein
MVETFALRDMAEGEKKELNKLIRDRCEECYVPRCWILKDPNDDGQISLKRKYISADRRERVQLRRLLFFIEYKHQPPLGRVIKMRCQNPRCINPSHMKVKGFAPSYGKVYDMIDRKILTLDEAAKWYREED